MPQKRDFNSYFEEVKQANDFGGTARKSYKVENAFVPVAKDGKYSIVMRFLPCHPSEFKPFVKNETHMFRLKNGLWFGCDCLGKFGKPCPICDYNKAMWKQYGRDEGKNHVLGKAKPKYISNVLIVRNPNAPDTEGKVFRFEYGPLIFKLITEAMTDHEDTEAGMIKAINPFDWKTGANFVYEGVQAGQFMKNDTSHFGQSRPINKWVDGKFVDLTDAEIDDIESKLYTLDECDHKEEDVKTYQEILDKYKEKLGEPLFNNGAVSMNTNVETKAVAGVVGSFDDDDSPSFTANSEPSAGSEDVEEADDFFAKLSNS